MALRTFHPRKPNVSLYSKGDSIGMAEDFSTGDPERFRWTLTAITGICVRGWQRKI